MILNCFTAEYKELPEFTTELFMKSGYVSEKENGYVRNIVIFLYDFFLGSSFFANKSSFLLTRPKKFRFNPL